MKQIIGQLTRRLVDTISEKYPNGSKINRFRFERRAANCCREKMLQIAVKVNRKPATGSGKNYLPSNIYYNLNDETEIESYVT